MINLFAGATQGVCKFKGGEIAFMDLSYDGGIHLRYEHGWYCTYREDGTRVSAGKIVNSDGTEVVVVGSDHRDVIEFIPMEWKQAKTEFPGIQAGLCP